MAGAGTGRVRAAAARAAAGLTTARTWGDRAVALTYLLTSLVLALLHLVPAAWLLGGLVEFTDTVRMSLLGYPNGAGVGGAFLSMILAPAVAATLLARAACWVGRARLAGLFGIVETPLPIPEPPHPRPMVLRVLDYLLGREAWAAVYRSTVIGLYGLFAGSLALGLVIYGVGTSAGILIGLGIAAAQGELTSAAPAWHEAVPFSLAVGPVAALLSLLIAPALIGAETSLTKRLLLDVPEAQVRRRLVELRDSRLRMVDVAEAERRRIERDLHDGAQQRLLAVTMTLARARAKFDRDPDKARELLGQAQIEAKAVMAELRDVARGLHPKVLTDHGLESALPVAAGRCPLPVKVRVDLAERPSPRAEGVAYYAACEALTNITKHAGAGAVTVAAERVGADDAGGDLLRLTVADDGAGGADPDAGTGLYGLWDRINAVDGRLVVHSPAGEGTVLTADIPWEA
ncbi:signal transduction histidine kinase [Murinocardiopsis flavida]|uniref:histidine kinase n=1 Tax=Murinocardiopsis flavida TaxID=645275 RepID=A0A2P8DMW5_9ACTN|nr:histidine kinase [Murinocardiopsis flavida]PSK98554.1 signal transduction histidine kinase [Murinocardiopsis flavida]